MTVRSRSDGPDLINLATGGARVTVAGGRRRRRRGMTRSGEKKRHGKTMSTWPDRWDPGVSERGEREAAGGPVPGTLMGLLGRLAWAGPFPIFFFD